jgi:peptidyl-prolyl cis-trans isomerase A (cyclophilin A)
MTRSFLVCLFYIFILSCNYPAYKEPHIVIETTLGDIEVELYPAKAPKTVAAFLSYTDSGYFKNSAFYRVLNTVDMSGNGYGIIQGGISQTNEKMYDNIPGIIHESTKQTGLSHTNGTISLARTTPGTASTEFFICIGDQTQFDEGGGAGDNKGFAAFGKVFNGMDIVRKIQAEPSHGEAFNESVKIKNIKRL